MKIPEDFTDKTLAIDDTQGDDVRGGDWGAGHRDWQGGMWRHLVAKFPTKARIVKEVIKVKLIIIITELKKVKKEFRCSYCDRFYKSIAALQKHINNIHTSDGKGEKRKNMNKHQHDGMYVKRNKGEPHKSIQYINYFE